MKDLMIFAITSPRCQDATDVQTDVSRYQTKD
jgi:hypothetical protein